MIQNKIPEFFHKFLLYNHSNYRFFASLSHQCFNYNKTKGFTCHLSFFISEENKKNPKRTESVFFEKFQNNFAINLREIFLMFRKVRFLRFMNENYKLMPFLFSQQLLKKFKNDISHSLESQKIINQWFEKPIEKRIEEISKLSVKFSMFSKKSFCYLKPFLELYLIFLNSNQKNEIEISQKLSKISDLREPHNWFPEARAIKRKIIYHHGPTNSGKTHNALLELEKAKNGVYCSPLRLLAWEVQEKLEKKGFPCTLITGQEKIIKDTAKLVACTVECTNLNENYDIALIDEIQMIGDKERGSAWTLAFLGLRAKVIHVCGDERAVKLIKTLCKITGDDLEEKTYTRFSNLYVENKLFNLSNDLKPGDCLIAFSVKEVHRLKNYINKYYSNGFNQCSMIYGRLPPESKKDQTKKFNDPTSEIKYLAATNAIGMGLNLKIKRVIFTSLMRMSSENRKIQIADHEIKQIAGRAGRYLEEGYISAMKHNDLLSIKQALKEINKKPEKNVTKNDEKEISDDEYLQQLWDDKFFSRSSRKMKTIENDIEKAILFPLFSQIENFANELENIEKRKLRLSYIFNIFMTAAQYQDLYILQRVDEFIEIADMIEEYNMNLNDHFIFATAPLNLNGNYKRSKIAFRDFAYEYQ